MLFLLNATVLGQITITSEDIPNEIGCRHALRASVGYVPVTLGPSGENQTWDLTSIPAAGDIEMEIVSRDSTPDPSAFPLANWIVKWEGEARESACAYASLTPVGLSLLGAVIEAFDTTTIVTILNWPPLLDFPLRYGDDYLTVALGEVTVAGIPMIFLDSAGVEVDGWGTVITEEMGSHSCLRLKTHHHIIITVAAVPLMDFTIWAYLWMVPQYPDFAMVISELNADEDFTSGIFVRLGAILEAEKVTQTMPVAFRLSCPYPNPFNPEVTIPYSIDVPATEELTVFNLLGQRVCTLIDGKLAAGNYMATWNGMDDGGNQVGTGVYYCHLLTPQGNAPIQRLVLLR
jgi:hypothetical protein